MIGRAPATTPVAAVMIGLAAAAGPAGPVHADAAIFVDDDAPEGGDGASWITAHRHLQDALAAADGPTIIHVGQGVYRPDRDGDHPGGSGDRARAFVLVSDLEILGGYAGLGAGDPDERDPARYVSILSGDLAGDDGPGFEGVDENSFHVVDASAALTDAALDGFVVTGGNANGGGEHAHGGGLRSAGGSLLVVNCIVRANVATGRGGGAYLAGGEPRMTTCRFDGNDALAGGGVMTEMGADSFLTECHLTGNTALIGGAVCGIESNFGLERSTLHANAAAVGGAAYSVASSAIALDCVFVANRADFLGGAFHGGAATPTLKRCTFEANTAGAFGGAVSGSGGAIVSVSRCGFAANATDPGGSGGAIYSEIESRAQISRTTFCGNLPDHIAGTWDDGGQNEFADTCVDACPADLDENGVVDFGDVILVIGAWGSCSGCPEDLDGSGEVDLADVLVVLTSWGPCPATPTIGATG